MSTPPKINLELLDGILKNYADKINGAINNGADVNGCCGRKVPFLHWAAEVGTPQTLKTLLDAGAVVNIQNSEKGTALHTAATENKVENAKILLEHGAHIDARNNEGDTALHVAAYNGYKKTVDLLLAAGADPSIKNLKGHTPAALAGKRDHPEMVDYLQSITKGTTPAPTPEDMGLDMEKRNAAVEILDRITPMMVKRHVQHIEKNREANTQHPHRGR